MDRLLEDLAEVARLIAKEDADERLSILCDNEELNNACYWFAKNHHATIRDMAARLESAERDAAKFWALHFHGPDDVVAAPSKQAAELAAKNFNAVWDAHKDERGHDVRVVANVIEWEHGFIEHAKSVIKHWPEYEDLLDQAMQETGR